MDSIGIVNLALMFGALVVVVGIGSSLIASRFGAPLLLVFLLIGMLAGEDGPGGLAFDDYETTYFVGSLALAIILFDGGLRTNIATLRRVIVPAGVLATVGVVITAALTGLFATVLLGLQPLEGLLIGAMVASTDAAAVFFLLRAGGLHLRRRVGTTLEVESGTNDPAAVFLTVVLVQLILAGTHSPGWAVLGSLASQGLIGAAVGVSGGFAVWWILNRVTMPAGLHPLFVVASAVLIFGLAANLQGSGFLAVYLAGLVLGNRPVRAFPSILSFHDAATWLVQLVMFIVLGLLVTPSTLFQYAVPGLAIATFLIFLGRPAAVWLCLTPFRFTASEKLFVSWVGLRGAVSIFLAAIPTLSGLPNGAMYFNIAFFVVLVSLVVQGWTLTWTAARLGVALPHSAPEPRRVEIDLPGQLEFEMVGYPVLEDSPILRRSGLPSWVRPVFVVRNNDVLSPEQAGALRGGDYGYFLVSPKRVLRLDALFAPREPGPEARPPGLFSFKGDVRLAEVASLYGLELPEDLRELTIAEAFAERFESQLEPGATVEFGPAALVAQETDGDLLLSAWLEIDDGADGAPAAEEVRTRAASPIVQLLKR